jgi:hypothetical protein
MPKIVTGFLKTRRAALPEGLARYFFNHRDAQHFYLDKEGACFETLAEARYEARQSAREMISHTLLTDDIVRWESAIEIADEHGQVIQVVSYLEAADFPARKDRPH